MTLSTADSSPPHQIGTSPLPQHNGLTVNDKTPGLSGLESFLQDGPLFFRGEASQITPDSYCIDIVVRITS